MNGIDFDLSQLLVENDDNANTSENHEYNLSEMLDMIPDESYQIRCRNGVYEYNAG